MSTQSTRRALADWQSDATRGKEPLRLDATRKANRLFREAKSPITKIGYRIDRRRSIIELFVYVDHAIAAAFDQATLHRLTESGGAHVDVRNDRKKQAENLLGIDVMPWSRLDIRLLDRNRWAKQVDVTLFPPEPAKAVRQPQPEERTPLPWQVAGA